MISKQLYIVKLSSCIKEQLKLTSFLSLQINVGDFRGLFCPPPLLPQEIAYIMMLYTTVINYYLLYIITICMAWTIDSCSDLVLEKDDVS